LPQPLQVRGHRVGVGVLRLQVRDDLRVLLVAEPLVGIGHVLPVVAADDVAAGRDGRGRSGGLGSHPPNATCESGPRGYAVRLWVLPHPATKHSAEMMRVPPSSTGSVSWGRRPPSRTMLWPGAALTRPTP